MSKPVPEYIFMRRQAGKYTSPPVCEADFSSTGAPVIVLDPFPDLNAPTGLELGGVGGFRLSWERYPGVLCYTVYKAVDELDPFGEYQIVAECISDNFIDLDSFGSGVYRVTAILPEGETEASDPITYSGYTPPVSCSQAGPAIPVSFLVEDAAEIVTTVGASDVGGSETFSIAYADAGRFEIYYDSGTVGADCSPAWVEKFIPSSRLEDDGGGSIQVENANSGNMVNSTTNYGYYSPFIPPFDLQAALVADFPDQVMAYKDLDPVLLRDTFGGTLDGVFIVNGSPNGLSCTPDGTSATFTFRRTHKFLPMPDYLSIPALASIVGDLDCGDGLPGLPWNGVIGPFNFYVESLIQYAIQFPGNIGGTQIFSVILTGQAGVIWTLDIRKSGGVIWSGQKTYGSTGAGNYARTSACNPNAPDCITVA